MFAIRHLLLLIAFLISSMSCLGRKYLVDSIDAVTKERVRISAQKISQYREFGKLLIEQRSNKYYISFPLLQYIHTDQDNVLLPKASVIIFECGAHKSVATATKEDKHVLWYCHWYRAPFVRPDGYRYGGTQLVSSHTNFNSHPDYLNHELDRYAFNWDIRIELTREDMRLLARRKITEAFVMRNGTKLELSMTKKQAKKIQRAINGLLHDKSKLQAH